MSKTKVYARFKERSAFEYQDPSDPRKVRLVLITVNNRGRIKLVEVGSETSFWWTFVLDEKLHLVGWTETFEAREQECAYWHASNTIAKCELFKLVDLRTDITQLDDSDKRVIETVWKNYRSALQIHRVEVK